MKLQRGFLEGIALKLLAAAAAAAIIGLLWWRVDYLTKDRDQWKGKAEQAAHAAQVNDQVLTEYADALKGHADQPAVRAAVDRLCDDLRVPEPARADPAPATGHAGDRRPHEAAPRTGTAGLAADLIAAQENKAQLRACQRWIEGIRGKPQ